MCHALEAIIYYLKIMKKKGSVKQCDKTNPSFRPLSQSLPRTLKKWKSYEILKHITKSAFKPVIIWKKFKFHATQSVPVQNLKLKIIQDTENHLKLMQTSTPMILTKSEYTVSGNKFASII